MRTLILNVLLTAVMLSPSIVVAESDEVDYSVDFLGRSINLEPYFQGYPYSGWNANFDSGKLLYRHTTPEGIWMMIQDFTGEGLIDPKAGRKLMDVDLSTRNLWTMRYDELGGDMIVLADERNDEVLNLYRMSLTDGSLKKLTNVPYIYGWNFSSDKKKIGYIARYGAQQPYRNCLTLLDLESGESTEVICEENGKHRMVWTTVNFSPDDRGVIVRLNRDGHRRNANLAWIDLQNPSIDILLPDGIERQSLDSDTDGWLDNNRVIYQSDETGYSNFYVYDLETRATKALTNVDEQAWFTPLKIDNETYIFQVLDRPHENVMQVLNMDGRIIGEKTLDQNIGAMGFDDKNRFVLTMVSAASPFSADRMNVGIEDGKATFSFAPGIRLPEDYANAVQQCKVERVSFKTFDIDPATGENRMLHAFLMTPKNPRANTDLNMAVITSFYGGGNVFSTTQQIFCEAGMAWFSPSVRGSFGFGKDFMALNDRDLGGDEIIDLFYAARFLEDKLGLSSSQIGVAGGSHGGYATMRALTFPSHTNNRNESYDFGFGMSHAGFSNIVTFYDATNIPDWIILEAGNPATEREKLEDRSPMNHTDLLSSPILLTHGENDSRVGVTESRQFVAEAKKLNKPVTYVEFEGQGHGISGLRNYVTYFQTRFDFLTGVVCNANRNRIVECAKGTDSENK
jgi:dipeptidyl aminopeptidase/acylaminoacyl peptidase